MGDITRIESQVPFGRTLAAVLAWRQQQLNTVPRPAHLEKPYLAWETVRCRQNPYFQKGTGFEGYLVGYCPTPEAALETVLQINQQLLDAIARLYRGQFGLQSRLMKTLTRERSDREAIAIWSAYLGAALGRLRSQMRGQPEAEAFRYRTYTLVDALPPIVYHQQPDNVTQTYVVGSGETPAADRLNITPQILKPGQQDAWLVAVNIGEFGHPLVRQFLDQT